MRTVFRFLVLIALSTSIAAQVDVDTAVIVELKGSQVELNSSVVHLKDIASVLTFVPDGRNERLASLRAELCNVGRLKTGAGSLQVRRAAVRKELVRDGFKATNVEIKGPEVIHVRRQTVTLNNRRILSMARRHIQDALAGIDESPRITFAERLKPVKVPVAKWVSGMRVEGDPNNPNYVGRVELRLVVEIDGRSQVVATIPMLVTRQVMAIRMARSVKKGAILKRSDIELEKREVSRLGSELFFRISDVVGMVVRRDMRKGDDVLRSDLKSTPVIRADDLINVRVRSGLLTVETICIALQEGAPGDRILVQNAETKGQFTAIVVDAKTAEIRRK